MIRDSTLPPVSADSLSEHWLQYIHVRRGTLAWRCVKVALWQSGLFCSVFTTDGSLLVSHVCSSRGMFCRRWSIWGMISAEMLAITEQSVAQTPPSFAFSYFPLFFQTVLRRNWPSEISLNTWLKGSICHGFALLGLIIPLRLNCLLCSYYMNRVLADSQLYSQWWIMR